MYWIIGLLGLALIVAPFALGYNTDTTALWTSLIIGAVTLVLAGFEAIATKEENWEYWLAALVGVVLVIAPFVLGFSAFNVALWTSVIVGIGIAVASGVQIAAHQPKL